MSASEFAPATDLRGIRRACSKGPLDDKTLGAWWVDSRQGRTAQLGFLDRVRDELDDCLIGQHAKIIVAGHRGCGKSTELAKLRSELPQSVCVWFSVLDEMEPFAVTAEDLLVIIAERIVAEAQSRGLHPDEKGLEQVYRALADVTQTKKEERESHLQFSAEAGVGAKFLGGLAKLLASMKADIKFRTDEEQSSVRHLRRRPSELIEQVNNIVKAVEAGLERGHRLIVMVEDLDKLDLQVSKKLFIQNTSLLGSVDCHIIYTIPIFTLYSSEAGVLDSYFRRITLPMIKVYEPGGDPNDPPIGHEIIRQIVHKRIAPEAIEETALNRAIQKTGGVLRDLFEVIRLAAGTTDTAIPLGVGAINFGLAQVRAEFTRRIALPSPRPEGVESVAQLYNKLASYTVIQEEGRKPKPDADPVNQILLQCGALVEYNGEGWAGVHPLVVEILRERGDIS